MCTKTKPIFFLDSINLGVTQFNSEIYKRRTILINGKRKKRAQLRNSYYSKHIPHNRIHRAMKNMGIARDEPRKQVRKKWIRYERKYSNSLWHTDWKLIDGLGWFTAYLDDASRFIVGYGLFPEATSEHSVEVLKEAIRTYGKPAAILTDRGTQFYAVETDEKIKGLTVFEKRLIENEIRQILSRVGVILRLTAR